MKLLFDENLAQRLVGQLADVYPESAHVREFGLEGAVDLAIWDFAAANGFAIATKDDDFRELATIRGAPPKVVMISLCNCSTDQFADLLTTRRKALEFFNGDRIASILELV